MMDLWKKIGRAIRHHLVLQKLTQRVLVKLGVKIDLYYWTQEGLTNEAPRGSNGGFEDYTFGAFGPEEMQTIASLVPWRPVEKTQAWLDEGSRCFGMKHHGQIAGYVWCNLTECSYRWHKVPLRDNEVYLFDQFTLDAFRGRSIAPYLRHRTYGALREMGRDTFYSGTHRLNRSAVRFKQKLGAQFLFLGLGVDLFGKVQRHCILRRYRA